MLTFAGCQSMGKNSDPPDSLYHQLGERSGIASIVEDLLYRIVEDPRINEQFRGIDVRQFHTNLTDQLCELSGGPCTYSGRGMRESHEEMNVTATQFNALAENLILAMEENDIPTGAQNRLIEKLVPLYPQIRNL
nr:group 1 truncated hemoglobin [Marinobacter vulgaris]